MGGFPLFHFPPRILLRGNYHKKLTRNISVKFKGKYYNKEYLYIGANEVKYTHSIANAKQRQRQVKYSLYRLPKIDNTKPNVIHITFLLE